MDLFVSILNMSIASSFLLLLVLLGRRLLRGLGSASFLYLLWLPLLFRMLVPYSLPSPASLFNLFDENLNLVHVFANGRQMMREGEIIVKGTFEE